MEAVKEVKWEAFLLERQPAGADFCLEFSPKSRFCSTTPPAGCKNKYARLSFSPD